MYIVQIWCVHNAFFSRLLFSLFFWKRCQNVCYAYLWFSEFLMSTEKVVHFNKAWTNSTQSHWVSYLHHETFEKHMWLNFNSLTYRNIPQNAWSLLDYTLKGIFTDSNNIFLWQESEDRNKKCIFPKFQLIPILHFQVMHDCVCFIAPIDYCVE